MFHNIVVLQTSGRQEYKANMMPEYPLICNQLNSIKIVFSTGFVIQALSDFFL